MMHLDTHKEIKNLIEKGFQEVQAEAITSLIGRYNDQLATKQDIALVKKAIESVRTELKHDIESVRTELKHDIESVRTELKHDIALVRTEIDNVRTELRSEIKSVESNLIKWIVPLLITIILANVGMAVGLFFK